MTEFFIQTNSFAAPFMSDTSYTYVEAESATEVVAQITTNEKGRGEAPWYKHPYGLYAANVYGSADDFHKNEKPLAIWHSPTAKKDWEA